MNGRPDNPSWTYTEYTEYGVAFWPVGSQPGFGPEPTPSTDAPTQRVHAQRLDRAEPLEIAAAGCEPVREPIRDVVRRQVDPVGYQEMGYSYVDGTITSADAGMNVSENYYAVPYATTWSTVEFH